MPDNLGDITLDAVDMQKHVHIVVHIKRVRLARLRTMLARPFLLLGVWLGGYSRFVFKSNAQPAARSAGGPIEPGAFPIMGEPGPEIMRPVGKIMPNEWAEREAPEKFTKWTGNINFTKRYGCGPEDLHE